MFFRSMLAGVIACFLLLGCTPEVYRAETKLLPDGSIERAISQPVERIPEASRSKMAGWNEVFLTQPVKKDADRARPIRALPTALGPNPKPGTQNVEQPLNFVGWGTFDKIEKIPDHFEFSSPGTEKKGRLIRDLKRHELGFVTEWEWNETLTDTIDLTDHRLARSEFAASVVKLALAIVKEGWGDAYDLQPLEKWLSTEATEAFHESLDLLLEIGIQKKRHETTANELRFKGILKRHGLDLLDAQGRSITDQEVQRKRAVEYVTVLVRKMVKDKQGQPLSQELLEDLLKTLGLTSDPPKQGLEAEAETKLSQAAERVVKTQYGGSEVFEKQINVLATRILGIYLWPIVAPPRSFTYQMEFPGDVIQTNGVLLTNRSVRWKFDAPDAFPLGYPMQATSVVVNSEAIRKNAPSLKLDTREQVLNFVNLAEGDLELEAALIQLASQGETKLWDAWLEKSLKSTNISTNERGENSSPSERGKKMRELLGK